GLLGDAGIRRSDHDALGEERHDRYHDEVPEQDESEDSDDAGRVAQGDADPPPRRAGSAARSPRAVAAERGPLRSVLSQDSLVSRNRYLFRYLNDSGREYRRQPGGYTEKAACTRAGTSGEVEGRSPSADQPSGVSCPSSGPDVPAPTRSSPTTTVSCGLSLSLSAA